MKIFCTINGDKREFDVSPSDVVLDVLRENGYTGAKRGCDTGSCGMCTVHVDGDPTLACITPARNIDESSVETIEGLQSQDTLHPLQEAFIENNALQCGFCTPGIIMQSKALLEQSSSPSESDVREALSGNICRCTGYVKIIDAVLDAAEQMPTYKEPRTKQQNDKQK